MIPRRLRLSTLKAAIRLVRAILLTAVVIMLPGISGAALAQSAPSRVMRIDPSGAATQSLSIPKGKSALVELPVDARDVMVTNPGVADAVLRSPRRISVLGVAPGQTDAAFFDASGRRILSLDIRVDQDGGALSDTIARVLPGSKVHVESINDSVILTGVVANAVDSDHAGQIAARYVSKPENVLNMLSVAGKDQVMLKVRIVEVQRSTIKQLGFNLSAVLNQLGESQYMVGTAATYAINGSLLGGVTGGLTRDTTKQPYSAVIDPITGKATDVIVSDHSPLASVKTGVAGSQDVNQAEAKIQAFERVGLVRTMAEPNLTAVSGEAARFLVGGEFPVPTGQDNTGKITIEFKQFGVGLGFTPVVLSGGRISLKLSAEVSELTAQGALSLAGLTVPGLVVRRASSTVELPSGGSLMMAGLIREQTKQNLDSVPGMMNLPVLGSLFRSRDFLNGDTELAVIVTAYIVDPTQAGRLQTPADGLVIASDLQTNLLGRLNQVVKAKPGVNAGRAYEGPIGYVIE